MAKLKVFRTPIGFHDAYVAATSRKAALRAWGAERDLFARGIAEEVTDPALTDAPLAAPGEVIRVSRGSVAEQLAALPERSRSRTKPEPEPEPSAKPRPKPSRAQLDAAEQALADVEARHEQERAMLAREEEALKRRKTSLRRAQQADVAKLKRTLEKADEAYRMALARWRAS